MNRRKKNEHSPFLIFASLFVAMALGAAQFISYQSDLNAKKESSLPKEDFSQTDDNPHLGNTSMASSLPPQHPDTSIQAGLPPAPQELFDFLKKADRKAKWVLTKKQNFQISTISGGVIKLPLKGIKTKAELAAHLAALTGIPKDQIGSTESLLPDTGFSRTLQYQQVYQGYSVDQAFVRLTERKADGAIFYSQIEGAQIGEPDLRINTQKNEIPDLALARFPADSKPEVLSVRETPLIFVKAPQQSELAWVVFVKIQSPHYDERRLTISAVSGQVLQDVSALQN